MIDAFLASEWFGAAMRLLFVGGIYLFLFFVLRDTRREIAAIASNAGGGIGGLGGATLVVLDPAGSSLSQGTIFPLDADSIIGRDAGVAVELDDPRVSARHAELTLRHDQWWLRDLSSSNGTTLNGQSVHSVVAVRSGDVLQCAAVRLRFIAPHIDSAERHVV